MLQLILKPQDNIAPFLLRLGNKYWRYTSIVASTIGADPSIPTIDPEVDVVDGALRNPEMGCCLFFLVSVTSSIDVFSYSLCCLLTPVLTGLFWLLPSDKDDSGWISTVSAKIKSKHALFNLYLNIV
jgi:hypothetical protein